MKLKNWLIAGILFSGLVTHLSLSIGNCEYTGISLSNIEALSLGETNGDCRGIGSVDCPTSTIKVQFVSYL